MNKRWATPVFFALLVWLFYVASKGAYKGFFFVYVLDNLGTLVGTWPNCRPIDDRPPVRFKPADGFGPDLEFWSLKEALVKLTKEPKHGL